jgi:hypothetical protein
MDIYPGNSHKALNAPIETPTDEAKPAGPGIPDPKKIEKVVAGQVVRRKKPLSKKFMETFVGGDAKSVWQYVVFDVLIPAGKDMVADAFSQGIERMLFGEARSTSRRTGARPGGNGYISYNRYSPSNSQRRDEPRERNSGPSRRARATHDFDEIILATRAEAQEVVDRLFDIVAKYGTVSVADLYELVGVTGSYTDDKWGWTDIRGASVARISSGYLLDLPQPEPIN